MIRRQVVVPVSAERLWEALTDPDQVAGWFGGRVDWDLREGGEASFRGDDGATRVGRIEAIRPGRHLRFRWWPAVPARVEPEQKPVGGASEPESTPESEVSYLLEPLDEGTRLTIQERPVPQPARPSGAQACAVPETRPAQTGPAQTGLAQAGLAQAGLAQTGLTATGPADRTQGWTPWDSRLFPPGPAWSGLLSAPDPPNPVPEPPEREVDAVFSALADPTRRRLLDQLSAQGPLTATELAASYAVTRQAVVKHLGALAAAGLLDTHRYGREVRYGVVPGQLGGASAWLADVGKRWDNRIAALQRHLGGPPDAS